MLFPLDSRIDRKEYDVFSILTKEANEKKRLEQTA